MSKTPIFNYDKIATEYSDIVDSKPVHLYYERPNTLSLLPNETKNKKLLDLGCGSGWYAEHLYQLGYEVTAVDVSEKMVDLTKQRLNHKVRCIQANLEEPLDFLDTDYFDIIIAPLVIHYIKDWARLFKELARITKSNAKFIFSTHQPHAEYQLFKLDSYHERQLVIDYWNEPNAQVRYYHHTLEELVESLHTAGFCIERLLEPKPSPEMKSSPKLYARLQKQPCFIFVRAMKL